MFGDLHYDFQQTLRRPCYQLISIDVQYNLSLSTTKAKLVMIKIFSKVKSRYIEMILIEIYFQMNQISTRKSFLRFSSLRRLCIAM